MSDFSFKLDIEDRLSNAAKGMGKTITDSEKVIQVVDVNGISNWEHRDRSDFEIGDIDALANSIASNGQAQPVILVKPSKVFKSDSNNKAEYILIAGYRRWLACKKIGIPIEAVVKEMNFEQAVSCLMSENEKESISEYSKGLFYKKTHGYSGYEKGRPV